MASFVEVLRLGTFGVLRKVGALRCSCHFDMRTAQLSIAIVAVQSPSHTMISGHAPSNRAATSSGNVQSHYRDLWLITFDSMVLRIDDLGPSARLAAWRAWMWPVPS